MWLSLNMLNDMIDLKGISSEDIALKLTMSTAETEDVVTSFGYLENIITAKLLEVEKHQDSDHLTVCKVDDGNNVHNVVCGASNHKKGDIVALAPVGTILPGDFEIKPVKIRGVESSGMLCSMKELELSDEHEGIIVFDSITKIGIKLSDIYAAHIDTRIEIDNKSITNRPDLWGHVGFARELSAIFDRKFKHPVDMSITKDLKTVDNLEVEIKCPGQAPRYCGLVVKNIKIGESPDWIKSRIISAGMRPINNIVDVTNYVMIEMGAPMHAFDRSKLSSNKIIVRMAQDGEKLLTLDEQEHKLCNEDVVIADEKGPIAIGGVMGGGNSEIDENTNEIVLEAANFNPVNIRKSAQRYNLRTDAAMRFEKSLDPESCPEALIRCYQLIKMLIPEAEAITEIVDAYPNPLEALTVETTCDYIRKALGKDLSDEQIIKILTALEYKIESINGSLSIIVPSYRATKDIGIAADIVEEVGRIYGYDNIEESAPMVPCNPPEINDKRIFERQVKNILSNNHNMIEVYNYSFLDGTILDKCLVNEDKELRLKNFLSVEHDRLRRSLVPEIISNIELNARNFSDFKIYEIGRTYLKKDRNDLELAKEIFRITGAVFNSNEKETLFYNASQIVKDMCSQFKLRGVQYMPKTDKLPAYAHPGRSLEVKIDGKSAGLIFELNPKVKNNFEIKGSAAIFDIDLDMMFSGSKANVKFNELQNFPVVPFEVSVIADKLTYSTDILRVAAKAGGKLVLSSEVVAVYEGSPIEEGKKSVSIKVIFGSNERTLKHEEIEQLQNSVVKALNKKGYNLR